MTVTRSQGIRLDYDDRGEGGPALLFLPGWCGSRGALEPLATRCAQWRRTLALDWRGHGRSGGAPGDFGTNDLADDAVAVIDASGVDTVIPVALSHAGWVAIELRRRLGARVAGIVLLDWIVLDAPPSFLAALEALQDPARWQQARDALFAMWLDGLPIPALHAYVREDMGAYPFEMWARAGREIAAAYASVGSPLQALSALEPPVPVLHVFAQPDDPRYLGAQQEYGKAHPWFRAARLDASSHFPAFEVPDDMAAILEAFASERRLP